MIHHNHNVLGNQFNVIILVIYYFHLNYWLIHYTWSYMGLWALPIRLQQWVYYQGYRILHWSTVPFISLWGLILLVLTIFLVPCALPTIACPSFLTIISSYGGLHLLILSWLGQKFRISFNRNVTRLSQPVLRLRHPVYLPCCPSPPLVTVRGPHRQHLYLRAHIPSECLA